MACYSGCFAAVLGKPRTKASKMTTIPESSLKCPSQESILAWTIKKLRATTGSSSNASFGSSFGVLPTLLDLRFPPEAANKSKTVTVGEEVDKMALTVTLTGTSEIGGVLYYCLQVPSSCKSTHEKIVMRRFADFVNLDIALAVSRNLARAKLPPAEVIGLRRRLNEGKFLQQRQYRLQLYVDVIILQGALSEKDEDVQDFLHPGFVFLTQRRSFRYWKN